MSSETPRIRLGEPSTDELLTWEQLAHRFQDHERRLIDYGRALERERVTRIIRDPELHEQLERIRCLGGIHGSNDALWEEQKAKPFHAAMMIRQAKMAKLVALRVEDSKPETAVNEDGA